MDRGIQDAEHCPVDNENFLHMMKGSDLDTLLENQNAQIETSSRNFFIPNRRHKWITQLNPNKAN